MRSIFLILIVFLNYLKSTFLLQLILSNLPLILLDAVRKILMKKMIIILFPFFVIDDFSMVLTGDFAPQEEDLKALKLCVPKKKFNRFFHRMNI